MKITAKIPLNLPNKFYKITLKYDTFEQATYDSYLMASLIHNAKNEKEIYKYIDEITGKGSLNEHFKKLYSKMKDFTKEQIMNILEDSLYPVTIVDKKNHFKYYPMFNATRFNGKTYEGNLIDKSDDLVKMLMPNNKECKFLSIDFTTEDGTIKEDIYDTIFTENEIKVDLEDEKYWLINKDDFDLVFKDDIDHTMFSNYEGKISNIISEGKWSVLRNSMIKSLLNYKNRYIDEEGNNCSVMDEYLTRTTIIQVYSLFFYKEELVKYERKNAKICERVVRHLLDSRNINEFKTKNLVNILKYVDDKLSQEVVNYILERKESKEISIIGLDLIKSGIEKGWNYETLKSIKKSSLPIDLKYLYKIESNLDYEDFELLEIDDTDLTAEDKSRKNDYLKNREEIIKQIRLMTGEITDSGIRQRMKKLPTKDSIHKSFNNFLNKYVGHKNISSDTLDLKELSKEYDYVSKVYNNDYQTIRERCEKLENK